MITDVVYWLLHFAGCFYCMKPRVCDDMGGAWLGFVTIREDGRDELKYITICVFSMLPLEQNLKFLK